MLSPRRPHKAFTLIELLVTIAIIGLLVGLVVVGGSKLRENAQAGQTRSMLAGLVGMAAEYEVATTVPVEHETGLRFDWTTAKAKNAPGSSGTGTIDWAGSATSEERANVYSERFVWAAYQLPTLRNALPSLGEDALVDEDDDGFLELRDPWGNSIAYAARNDHPGGDDFLPEHENPFFASPGPDMLWGEPKKRGEFTSDAAFESYRGSAGYTRAQDNLYSFDIDRGAAVRDN